jgi:hypothetical protein
MDFDYASFFRNITGCLKEILIQRTRSCKSKCVVQPKGNISCGECFEMFGRFCLYGFLYVRLHCSFV